ncbi:TPA: EpsG family protein [Klebsiella pneumoniae]|uniref:EpsG family protein n=1 Tax=Klebsiella pneumoniae TaxID=573 RepID=UPI000A268EB4|nr:EpsG family protein [Klebsiella pneumoniae]MCP5797461.1 EpsG family protein [Klebsiella pneumoniae]HDE2611353.1 EpsG family protein [Klebsiella pneumoniae]
MITRNQHNLINISVFIFFGVLLILAAGLRPVGIDPDSHMYADFVRFFVGWPSIDFMDKEPGFWLILFINKFFFSNNISSFFLIYAALSISFKLILFYKLSSHPIVTLFLYISTYYFLHDMTQIRIGLACVFILWSLEDILQRNKLGFLIKVSFATLFHYSAIISLIFYFFSGKAINKKLYALLPLVGFSIYFLSNSGFGDMQSLLGYLPSFLEGKGSTYIDLQSQGIYKENNLIIMNVGGVVSFGFLLLLLWKADLSIKLNIILLKILSIQLFLGFILAFNSEVSNRFYTLIGFITVPLLFPAVIECFKPRWFGYLLVMLYAARQFYSSIVGVFLSY